MTLETAPTNPSPARAEYLARTVGTIARLLTDQLVRELLDGSTDSSSSLQDRALLAIVRPYVPRLQGALLSRLSSVDPATLERTLGAVAATVDELLAAAPGEALPRSVFRWDQAAGGLVLVPLEP